ncbi:MAG: Unknown protein [uncultured Sulfurovum sp.]|uniref:Guanylate cyclase domain-containing protein n=1 Tax=uncultured Sulfurovum sp. TaxID=269237 RepID=A0A6S6U7K4_9BACT|nr:MAG: Unknown protein [uncultured Sulfurovum sp.]
MSIKNILDTLDEEVSIIHSSDFDINIKNTTYISNNDDSSLTFENFDKKYKKVKIIETCVLYIDIRSSTKLNLKHYPETMAKLYSSFIRSMLKGAEHFNGKVKNIVGDRVMVVFDSENCYTEAVNTAILMNTISQNIINKRFKNNVFTCGIGIDFGKMMITKCGTIKYGSENSSYKSLVWLGRPANIASKLTDSANKPSTNTTTHGVNVGIHYKNIDEWVWQFNTPEELKNNIVFSYTSPNMRHKDDNFSSFVATTKNTPNYDSTPPILMTEKVYKGFKADNPLADSIKNNSWKKKTRKIKNYTGAVYGGDVIYEW